MQKENLNTTSSRKERVLVPTAQGRQNRFRTARNHNQIFTWRTLRSVERNSLRLSDEELVVDKAFVTAVPGQSDHLITPCLSFVCRLSVTWTWKSSCRYRCVRKIQQTDTDNTNVKILQRFYVSPPRSCHRKGA